MTIKTGGKMEEEKISLGAKISSILLLTEGILNSIFPIVPIVFGGIFPMWIFRGNFRYSSIVAWAFPLIMLTVAIAFIVSSVKIRKGKILGIYIFRIAFTVSILSLFISGPILNSDWGPLLFFVYPVLNPLIILINIIILIYLSSNRKRFS